LGRGAFGTAILYRREDDKSLVVIKEFDLTHTAEKTRAQVRASEHVCMRACACVCVCV
jgi:hypothetical protein